MKIAIYSLLSHTDIWLKTHIKYLRQNLPETNRIVIVQGPYGSFNPTSSGNIKLTQLSADKLGVELLEVPPDIAAGYMVAEKEKHIIKLIMEKIANQPEELALIIHGDCFPVSVMTSEQLLKDKLIAGRDWYGLVASTWLLFYKELANSKTLKKLNRLVYKWDVERPLSAERQQSLSIKLPTDMIVEWCEPGWLHLNGMSAGENPDILEKQKIFKDYLSLDNEKICEVLTNLPFHTPHVYTPEETKQAQLEDEEYKRPNSFPPITTRISNYLESRKIWAAAGKPLRSQEKVNELFQICKNCIHYQTTTYACDICGCYINEKMDWNKLAWSITKCPDNPPQWLEEKDYQPNVSITDTLPADAIPEGAIPLDPEPIIPPPPPTNPQKGGCGC